MACKHIDNKFAYIDCGACNGEGHTWLIGNDEPPTKEPCKACGSTCLVKIPLKDIPIKRIPKSSVDIFFRDVCNGMINLSAERKP
jgi:hypothetical protein